MVRQWQQAFYGQRYSHSNMESGSPDFTELAKAFNIKSISLKKRNELSKSLRTCLEYNGPFILDCHVLEEENCYPMVAPGKSNSQMIGIKKQNKVSGLKSVSSYETLSKDIKES